MTGNLHPIDHTVQFTREWVRDLGRLLSWDDEQRTWRMMRVSLPSLSDWRDVNEAAQLGAQLPMLVRGLDYEGRRPAKTPVDDNSRAAFLAGIEAIFVKDPIDDPEESVCSVFRHLNNHISAGEVEDVRLCLPKHLRELWPE